MTVRVGPYAFDEVSYDKDRGVLHLRSGRGQSVVDTFASAEGHAVRLDEHGEVTESHANWLF